MDCVKLTFAHFKNLFWKDILDFWLVGFSVDTPFEGLSENPILPASVDFKYISEGRYCSRPIAFEIYIRYETGRRYSQNITIRIMPFKDMHTKNDIIVTFLILNWLVGLFIRLDEKAAKD